MKQIKGVRLAANGRFTSLRDEPLAKKVNGVRVPISIYEPVKAKGGDWIREVIAEKLQRESLISISAEEKAVQRIDRQEDPSNYIDISEEEIDIESVNEYLKKRGKKQISIAN